MRACIRDDFGVCSGRGSTWRCCSTSPLLQCYSSLDADSQSATTPTSFFSQSTSSWQKSARERLALEYVRWAVAACPGRVCCTVVIGRKLHFRENWLRHLWSRLILCDHGTKKIALCSLSDHFETLSMALFLSANTRVENTKYSKNAYNLKQYYCILSLLGLFIFLELKKKTFRKKTFKNGVRFEWTKWFIWSEYFRD